MQSERMAATAHAAAPLGFDNKPPEELQAKRAGVGLDPLAPSPVSYTHLTLPTILLV